jgi:hypothetical protein
MGYGYTETFLIVFLTHPSVIIPDIAALMKMAPQIPPEFAAFANVPPQLNALYQVFWFWVLSLPGTRSPGFGWTMYAVYIVFLMVYAYFFLSMRLSKGV